VQVNADSARHQADYNRDEPIVSGAPSLGRDSIAPV
jgi:hypothetical protein